VRSTVLSVTTLVLHMLCRGLDNAGKTTTVKKLCGEDISTVSPTLGFQIRTVHKNGYALNVWDVGGQKSLRSYWRNYFEKTDALVWVIDSMDVARMGDCADELHKLLKEERLAGATLLVLANKQDAPGSIPVQEIERKHLRLNDLAGDRHWNVYESSAVSGKGLDEAFTWLINDVSKRLFLLD
jgi:ADP-ribosylation factor-like protein 2